MTVPTGARVARGRLLLDGDAGDRPLYDRRRASPSCRGIGARKRRATRHNGATLGIDGVESERRRPEPESPVITTSSRGRSRRCSEVVLPRAADRDEFGGHYPTMSGREPHSTSPAGLSPGLGRQEEVVAGWLARSTCFITPSWEVGDAKRRRVGVVRRAKRPGAPAGRVTLPGWGRMTPRRFRRLNQPVLLRRGGWRWACGRNRRQSRRLSRRPDGGA